MFILNPSRFASAGGGGPLAFQQDSGSDGLVVIEAQNYHEKVDGGDAVPAETKWELTTSANSLSGAYMLVPDQGNVIYSTATNLDDAPYLEYRVNFINTGNHSLWCRNGDISNTSIYDDSFHFWLDGTHIATQNGQDKKTWSDVYRSDFTIFATGVHTIQIQMREDGFPLDRLVISTNSSYAIETNGDTLTESTQS